MDSSAEDMSAFDGRSSRRDVVGSSKTIALFVERDRYFSLGHASTASSDRRSTPLALLVVLMIPVVVVSSGRDEVEV